MVIVIVFFSISQRSRTMWDANVPLTREWGVSAQEEDKKGVNTAGKRILTPLAGDHEGVTPESMHPFRTSRKGRRV